MSSMKRCLLFLGAISLTDPGRSTCPLRLLMSILGFFSTGVSLLGGGEGLFSAVAAGNTDGAVDVGAVDVGFLRPLREGGGGASSVRPWDRNLDWYVFTVAVFSVSRRISIDIDAFLFGMDIDFGFCTSASPSLDFLSDALAVGGGISLLSFSFSFLEEAVVDDDEYDLSLSLSRLRSLDMLEFDEVEEDDDDEDFEDLCLLDDEDELEPSFRSLSLLELELELDRGLSLSRCLSLELRWDEDELFEELFEFEDDEDDLWLDEEDLWLLDDFLSLSRSFSDLLLLSRALLCFLSASSSIFESVVLLSSKLVFSELSKWALDSVPLDSEPVSDGGKELSSSLYTLSAVANVDADLSTVLIVITILRLRSAEVIV